MRMRIPSLLLTKLYVKGSLFNEDEGFQFTIKNVLAPGTAIKFLALHVDGKEHPLHQVLLLVNGTEEIEAVEISSQAPLSLGLGREVTFKVRSERLSAGPHEIVLSFLTREVDELRVPFRDTIEG
jgi:hypothetical protein